MDNSARQTGLSLHLHWTSSRWSCVKQKKFRVFWIRREMVQSQKAPVLADEQRIWVSFVSLWIAVTWKGDKTCRDVTCIIVYSNGIVDFDIQMRNGHRFIFYCVWLEKKKKDLLVGCFINLVFPFSNVRTATINTLIDFNPYKCAQASLGGKHPYMNEIQFS